jgi:hypothetical protein
MQRFLLAATLSIPLLLRSDRADEPRFAVGPASTLRKAFEHDLKVDSTAVRIYVAGVDELVDGSATIGVTIQDSGRIEVTDEYLAMAEGRPGRLRRTFDRVESREDQEMRFAMGSGRPDSKNEKKKLQSSDLEGRTVLFSLDRGSGAYAAAFAAQGGDESLLEGLSEDMDFQFLLPAGKVAPGESWSVEPKACAAIFAPAAISSSWAGRGRPRLGDRQEIRRNLEGRRRRPGRIREEDGRTVGSLALTRSRSAGESAQGLESRDGPFRMQLELTGDLLWDLEAGHFRSFRPGAS